MYVEPRQTARAEQAVSAQQEEFKAFFGGLPGLTRRLLAAVSQRQRATDARRSAMPDLTSPREPTVAPMRSQHHRFTVTAVIAAVALSIGAAGAAHAEGEGNGDPFLFRAPGQVFNLGPRAPAPVQTSPEANPSRFPATGSVAPVTAPPPEQRSLALRTP